MNVVILKGMKQRLKNKSLFVIPSLFSTDNIAIISLLLSAVALFLSFWCYVPLVQKDIPLFNLRDESSSDKGKNKLEDLKDTATK